MRKFFVVESIDAFKEEIYYPIIGNKEIVVLTQSTMDQEIFFYIFIKGHLYMKSNLDEILFTNDVGGYNGLLDLTQFALEEDYITAIVFHEFY